MEVLRSYKLLPRRSELPWIYSCFIDQDVSGEETIFEHVKLCGTFLFNFLQSLKSKEKLVIITVIKL